MNKKFLLLGMIIVMGIFLSFFSGQMPLTGSVTRSFSLSAIGDVGEINVYFCPQDDCEGKLLSVLNSATQSIHCALFEVNLQAVKDLLREKEKIIEVQVVVDNLYTKEFHDSFVRTDKSGLMHDKFCIVDGKNVFTGSMNPTQNDAYKNNNNIFVITSLHIAHNYEEEFQEMWNGTFKKGNLVENPVIEINGTIIKTYFCPEDNCAAKVQKELAKAQTSIDFMTFSFTHEGIANAILFRYLEGVTVRGVFERRQIDEYSQYPVLAYNLGTIRKDGNKNTMHHKVFIIDGKTVVTGSFNPTKGGDQRNDENLLIIMDERIAQLFTQEFEKVYAQAAES